MKTQTIGLIGIILCLAYGIHRQTEPKEIHHYCEKSHYLDSTYYYVTKSSITLPIIKPVYVEVSDGFWEKVNYSKK